MGGALFSSSQDQDKIKFGGYPGGRTLGDTMYLNDGSKSVKGSNSGFFIK